MTVTEPMSADNQPFPDARALMRKYQLGAKKSWGQNFLVSERVYRAIVDAAVSDSSDWVVEFGAGLGTLTMRLAERIPEGKLLAVERDRDMVGVLRGELAHLDNVDIVEANALSYDLAMVGRWHGEPITVCGNLPYHIASQLIFRILAAREHVARAVVMIQLEMAERMAAGPGSKTYGALSVLVQTYAQVRIVVRAKPSAFVPPPKVTSAVIRLDLHRDADGHHSSLVPIADHEHYANVVHAAFHQRRKTLRNTLGAYWPAEQVQAALSAAEIDGRVRGETLGVAEFARLAAALPVAERSVRASS